MGDMDYVTLEQQYRLVRNTYLVGLAERLQEHLMHFVGNDRIDRLTCRAKEVRSFIEKAKKTDEQGRRKYDEPLRQIQDQIGARVVTFFKSDVPRVQRLVESTYARIETLVFVPETLREFGYEGIHYIAAIPPELMPGTVTEEIPRFFELQIKTLFQHAWAQAEHDITYKPNYPWTNEHKRKVAFTAAQAWGADMIFDELYKEQESRSSRHEPPDQRI